MKKRVCALIIAMTTIAASMAGCGSSTTSESAPARESRNNRADTTAAEEEAPAEMYSEPVESESDYITSDEALPADAVYGINSVQASKGAADNAYYDEAPIEKAPEFNTEEYSAIDENGFASVATSPLSTFSADVDTASYANVRRFADYGYSIDEIPSGSVRTEEMINYFSYSYDGPKKGEPFGINAEIADCPWNEDNKLIMLGLQTEAIDFSEAPDSNIVFLIDVSGSMYDENKLPLLKKSFELMVDNLTEKDKVSIVTYAGSDTVVIEGVPASEKDIIVDALESLQAGGSTNGASGIQTAYELAEEYFIRNGNNRVIIATDGDFNVGITSQSELKDLITEEKEKGVFLSVLGFGMGNYSDTNMETLADAGNGNYAYIDSLSEAKKVLVEELGATMVTVAKDVKLQVEFNPAYVAEYRLLGYEDRALSAEDFSDDTKDAGEIGAGHSVTALYEIVPAGKKIEEGNLKYQNSKVTDEALESDEWLTLSVRYKEPNKDKSKLLEYPIGKESVVKNPSDDFRFAACVAEFAEILRGSKYVGDVELDDILDELKELDLDDEYKDEFYDIVREIKRNSR